MNSHLPSLLREWGKYRSAYSASPHAPSTLYQIVLNCGKHFPQRHPHVYLHELETASPDCYSQAWRRFQRTPGLRYCEGWLAVRGNDFPIVHGWCVAANGLLVLDSAVRQVPAEYYGVLFKNDFAREQWRKLDRAGAAGILAHMGYLGLRLADLVAGLELPPAAIPESLPKTAV